MLVEISRTSEMKFKDFKEPDLFSRTFQNWKMKEKNSRIFKDLWKPCKKEMKGLVVSQENALVWNKLRNKTRRWTTTCMPSSPRLSAVTLTFDQNLIRPSVGASEYSRQGKFHYQNC